MCDTLALRVANHGGKHETYGAVADFLNMSLPGIDNPFSFNVADVAIFAGAFGLVIFTGRDKTP